MSDPVTDAQGREVFTVHPQLLAGGAPYRKLDPRRLERARPSEQRAEDDER